MKKKTRLSDPPMAYVHGATLTNSSKVTNHRALMSNLDRIERTAKRVVNRDYQRDAAAPARKRA